MSYKNKNKDNIDSYNLSLECIAKIHTDFPEKFGIPRQSGVVDALKALIIFESKFRNPDAFRGLEGFSHIWLIWGFHNFNRDNWSPMVKPPRLGGNRRTEFAMRLIVPNLGLHPKLDKPESHELGPSSCI